MIVWELNIVFDIGKVMEWYEFFKCYVIEWYVLYTNDVNSMKLMSYIWDNVWVVVWWYVKYEKPMFNGDPLASLMI